MNALRFTRLATFAWSCAFVAGLAPSASGGIVYTMTNASDLQNGWALSGTITVSGTGTNLGSADITGWAYTVIKESDSRTFSSSDPNASVTVRGLLATPTQLIVKYAPNDVFQTNSLLLTRPSVNELIWNTGRSGLNSPRRYVASDNSSNLWSNSNLNLAFPSTTADGWVIGTVVAPVPEIDPAGMGSVLALVTGALGLLERRRLKTA